MLGLAGASGTGKTTLAATFAELSGWKFLQTSTRATFERLGYDTRKDYDFGTRLMIQQEILCDADKAYTAAKGKFITDRTPLDMLAYTMADIQRQNVSVAERVSFAAYTEECFKVLNRHFPIVLVVQPGIPMKDDGVRPACPAYAEHINTLVLGLVVDERFKGQHYFVPRDYLDLNRRVDSINYALRRAGEKHEIWMRTQKECGTPIVVH